MTALPEAQAILRRLEEHMHEEACAVLDARAQQGLKATAEEAIHWGGLRVLFRLHDEIQSVTRLPHELEEAIEEYLAKLTPAKSADQS